MSCEASNLHNFAVVCEYAGSGQFIKSFKFDFANMTCEELMRRFAKNLPHEAQVLVVNARLFVGHNGPELTVRPGLFGTELEQAIVAAREAWHQAQLLQQTKQLEQHMQKFPLVLAVATYNVQDVFAGIMSRARQPFGGLSTGFEQWLSDYMQETSYSDCTSDGLKCVRTYKAQGLIQLVRPCVIRLCADSKGVVVMNIKKKGLVLLVIRLTVHELLNNANIMTQVFLCSEHLRNDVRFMAFLARTHPAAAKLALSVNTNNDLAKLTNDSTAN